MTWVGKTKQDEHRSREEGVGTEVGPVLRAQCHQPKHLGPFLCPSLTLTPGVVLLHFNALLEWEEHNNSTFWHGLPGNVQGRTWSASSQ